MLSVFHDAGTTIVPGIDIHAWSGLLTLEFFKTVIQKLCTAHFVNGTSKNTANSPKWIH